MPTAALLVAGLGYIIEQTVQSAFGIAGLVGFGMLTVGVKAGSVPCSCLGAFMLFVQVKALIG
ncbi:MULTISPECIES: hypothetical protein [unclassified Streptomyces]|uniref:hypothetical protein n=1 Tax=unclassified Streptomyces TaxID=2593676 RepID=UPI002E1625C5|nr:hypothetical protein OG452_18635 [Streptomyces sp. NBC_01197]WSS50126.1 hypothetical protein OG708_16615 [Streptomyces sp. NBC_01180]